MRSPRKLANLPYITTNRTKHERTNLWCLCLRVLAHSTLAAPAQPSFIAKVYLIKADRESRALVFPPPQKDV